MKIPEVTLHLNALDEMVYNFQRLRAVSKNEFKGINSAKNLCQTWFQVKKIVFFKFNKVDRRHFQQFFKFITFI